jgi:hypothetical protein
VAQAQNPEFKPQSHQTNNSDNNNNKKQHKTKKSAIKLPKFSK